MSIIITIFVCISLGRCHLSHGIGPTTSCSSGAMQSYMFLAYIVSIYGRAGGGAN